MAVDVTAFSAMARAEFMQGKMDAEGKGGPAEYASFVTSFPSTTRVETHTWMTNIPRLKEFKGYSPGSRLTTNEYTIANKEYRVGPVTVRKTDLDDDQVGGYLKSIQALPERGNKDIGFAILAHLAAGGSKAGFDGTNFFANSHVVGSGDNLDTFDGAANDGVTHKIIALINTNPAVKPVVFQDRESISALMTDADTPQAAKLKEYEYWVDCRFGLGFGYWWDAIHLTITDTPSQSECQTIFKQIADRFRTFTLPKGKDTDDSLYVHEGWVPDKSNTVLLCNLGLAEVLRTAIMLPQVAAGGGGAVIDNIYKDWATLIPTSALN